MGQLASSAFLFLFWLHAPRALAAESTPAVSTDVLTDSFIFVVVVYIVLACFLVGVMIWRIHRGDKTSGR